ncbi:acylneuraminate cytidylyltransferase family protein [Flammeovirgaceae bacterium]
MDVLGLIPARAGSKGVKGKNIKKLDGIPLINYTVEAALRSSILKKIIVSTDSKEIGELCEIQGISVPFIRPDSLSGDNVQSVEVVKHAIEFLNRVGEHYDAVCLLQPTSPFRKAGLIDQCLLEFKSSNYDSLVTVLEVPHQFNPAWVLTDKSTRISPSLGWKNFLLRRQELPPAFYRDGAVYISKVKGIFKYNRLVFGRIGKIVGEESFHVNIDSQNDWKIAEKYAKLWKLRNG